MIDESKRPPTNASVSKAIDVAVASLSPKAAIDLSKQLKLKFIQLGVAKGSEKILVEVENFAKNMQLQTEQKANPWRGEQDIVTGVALYQQNLASQAAEAIAGESVTFHYSIDDDASFLRGYEQNGRQADEKTEKAMDAIFNAWLVKHDLLSRGGVIYKSDKHAQPEVDEKGNPIRVNADNFRKLMASSDEGLSAYALSSKKDLEIKVAEHPYEKPKQAPEQQEGPQ